MAFSTRIWLFIFVAAVVCVACSGHGKKNRKRIKCDADDCCPDGQVCRKRTTVRQSRHPECRPDIMAVISDRLREWSVAWDARDYPALEAFYAEDGLFLPPGAPIRRGRAGFGQFIEGLITANNWGTGVWSVNEVDFITEDHVTSVGHFVIQSSSNGAPTVGKDVIVWKKEDGVLKLYYEAINFDS